MPNPVTYSGSGARVTVNQMINNPLAIRERLLRMMDQQFIMSAILRNAGNNNSGVIAYNESTPQFADDDAFVVAEGGEIPLTTGQQGAPKAAFTVKTALGIEVTRETRDRNRMDILNMRLTQVKNTMIRHWEKRLFNALLAAVPAGNVLDLTPSVAVRAWNGGSAPTIRKDILDAMLLVSEATAPGLGADDFLGFIPDTLVVSTRTRFAMMNDATFRTVYEQSPLASKNPYYTGQLERDVLGLNVLSSRFMNDDYAFLMQAKVVGGYSDERPLSVSPTYPDQPREVWRADTVRRTAIFIDQPLAIAKINNIKNP